jgi:xanthine dehydrogenase accessory factor
VKNLFEKLYESIASGQDAVLVSIVASSGSTPRGEGARMMLNGKGEFLGTIGGGAVEYKSQQLAAEVLKNKKSFSEGFTLAPSEVADLGMICGGDVKVYFQYFAGSDAANIEFLKNIVNLYKQNVNSWLITELSDETAWSMSAYVQGQGFFGDDNASDVDVDALIKATHLFRADNGKTYYAEPLTKAGKVYIFGGGHISQELVPVLSHVDFSCVVMDDREQFTDPRLFPQAENIILGDFYNIAKDVKIGKTDYIVIVTRGHKNDYDVLLQALRTDACYIGMIGSRIKVAAAFQKVMDEEGFSQADIDRVNSPIGLKIKAETPAEIAISIAGEMIERRASLKSQ